MRRPKFTNELVVAASGVNNTLIRAVYAGIREVPLTYVFPHLDIREVFDFAAYTWMERDRNSEDFRTRVLSSDFVDLFADAVKSGERWCVKHRRIPEHLNDKWKKLNPFSGDRLSERLKRISNDILYGVRNKLLEPTKRYVFECQYSDEKADFDGDNYLVYLMSFQRCYLPTKKYGDEVYERQRLDIINRYGREIVRLMKNYLYEIVPLPQVFEQRGFVNNNTKFVVKKPQLVKKRSIPVRKKNPKQLDLF